MTLSWKNRKPNIFFPRPLDEAVIKKNMRPGYFFVLGDREQLNPILSTHIRDQ